MAALTSVDVGMNIVVDLETLPSILAKVTVQLPVRQSKPFSISVSTLIHLIFDQLTYLLTYIQVSTGWVTTVSVS